MVVATRFFAANAEARRMVEQGGIQIDGNKIADPYAVVANAPEIMVQKGKKVFLKVVRK